MIQSGIYTDHPRSRGEYRIARSLKRVVEGSSPLSRGIPGQLGGDFLTLRIIPALAGNTTIYSARIVSTKDHPRSRGEYGRPAGELGRPPGSSPLSRGILRLSITPTREFGIIPALAGNTPPTPRKTRSSSDHPRSRGEYVESVVLSPSVTGSSPLSRGILGVPIGPRHHGRIIPALAGNTSAKKFAAAIRSDHPRSRGEYLALTVTYIHAEGSSPLSRGIRSRTSIMRC